MTVTPAQLYILRQIVASSTDCVYADASAHKPNDAPFDYDLPAFRGLVSRGLATVHGRWFYHITDSGRRVAERYVLCPACSRPARLGNAGRDRLAPHKCPHKLPCVAAAIERDSRLFIQPYDPYNHRSRDCAACNQSTDFQRRNAMGPRMHYPYGTTHAEIEKDEP